MSKWLSKNLFDGFAEEKVKEVEDKGTGLRRSDFVWQTPQAGTADKAKIYEGRFLPDPKGKFTKKYFYHMWKSGEKWQFYICPKTHGMDQWCPVCSIVSNLYTGTQDDKTMASKMKRKERYIGNFYIVDDPRDKDAETEERKNIGKVKLYEYPTKLDSKLKNEITDKKEGLGSAIFDPGAEGHNFIIKIKTTKTDAKGQSYPDYADSLFSRKPVALGTDKEIKTIMESTYSIDDYIKSLEISKEATIEMLKKEMLWDMISSDFTRNWGSPMTTEASTGRVIKPADDDDDVSDDIAKPTSDDDLSDQDLLDELKKM